MTVDRKPNFRIDNSRLAQRLVITMALFLEGCAQAGPIKVVQYSSPERGLTTISVRCYEPGPYVAEEIIPVFPEGQQIEIGGQNIIRRDGTVMIPDPIDSLMNVSPMTDVIGTQGVLFTVGTVTFTAGLRNEGLVVSAECFNTPDVTPEPPKTSTPKK